MNKKLSLTMAVCAVGVLAACQPAATPYEQQRREHEIACTSGTIAGALIGGVIGNQFGGGTGRDIMTGAGAVAGGMMGNSYSCG